MTSYNSEQIKIAIKAYYQEKSFKVDRYPKINYSCLG